MTDTPTILDRNVGELAAICRWNAVDLLLDAVFFTADRGYRVTGIRWRVDIAGTDLSAVSAVIRKVASGAAVSAGTALHTGSLDLKSSANGAGSLTLSSTASDLVLAAGDSLAVDLSGLATAAQGCVTVYLAAA